MGIKKYFLLSLVIISLLAAGCSNNQNSMPSDQVGDQEVQAIEEKLELEKTELEKSEVDNLLSLQNQLNEIVSEGDSTRCQELSLEQFVVSCEVNILSAQAKSADEVAVCDEASNEDIKNRCIATVKLK